MHPVDANGNPVEVFIYNGTTYLPARAVSTAVGKPISWDGKTQTIDIGKHDSEEPVAALNDLDVYTIKKTRIVPCRKKDHVQTFYWMWSLYMLWCCLSDG